MTDESKLQEALDALDHGDRWTKGNYWRGGRMCAIGALRWAHDVEFSSRSSYAYRNDVRRLALILNAPRPFSRSFADTSAEEGAVVNFNDADNTTWEDVALAFKKAIHDDDDDGSDG